MPVKQKHCQQEWQEKKIKNKNAQRAREAKDKSGQEASRKGRGNTEKRVEGESGEKKGGMKIIRRGLKALKEIKKVQSGTDMLI